MGGAVSSGNDNNELVDNLMREKYIRSNQIEQVFRALDRANYMTPDSYDQAYKDLAWMDGPLHLSSPCIYSEVMEGLMLHKGLSFLNIGSGTGYLSSMVGLILGCQGINHGVEVHPEVHEYAMSKLATLLESSPVIDDFDFCQPKFFHGNGLCLVPLKSGYDRVYCGAACPKEYVSYFRNLLKVGGILVMPLESKLVQIRRVGRNKWETRNLLSVTFAPLRLPTPDESKKLLKLDEQLPPRLQELCRGTVRAAVRGALLTRHPELRPRAPRAPPPAPRRPRRICIPVDAPPPHLGALHDLDSDGGADEMNALLNLVISMGHSRVAGALRYDRVDSDTDRADSDADAEPEPPRPAARARRPRDARRDTKKKARTDARSSKKDRRSSKLPRDEAEDGPSGAGAQTRARRRAAADAAPSTSRPQDDSQKLPRRKECKSQSKDKDRTLRLSRLIRRYRDSEDNSKDENDSNSGASDEDEPAKAASGASEDSSDWASEEDATPDTRAKRQKLDSGLGGSSPSASPPSPPSPSFELPEQDDVTDIEDDEEPARPCPKASRAVGGADVRCVRVSRLMRRGVARLPLPPALNRFVNLDREPEED